MTAGPPPPPSPPFGAPPILRPPSGPGPGLVAGDSHQARPRGRARGAPGPSMKQLAAAGGSPACRVMPSRGQGWWYQVPHSWPLAPPRLRASAAPAQHCSGGLAHEKIVLARPRPASPMRRPARQLASHPKTLPPPNRGQTIHRRPPRSRAAQPSVLVPFCRPDPSSAHDSPKRLALGALSAPSALPVLPGPVLAWPVLPTLDPEFVLANHRRNKRRAAPPPLPCGRRVTCWQQSIL